MIKAKDINSQRFEKAAFGYKQEDVDTFLSEIAVDYAQLMRDNEDINAKLQVLADKVREYRKDEEAVKDALLIAQKEGHRVVQEAGDKAEEIIRNAKVESDRMVSEATTDTKKAIDEVRDELKREQKNLAYLQKQVSAFKKNLFDVYKSHLEMISSLPQSDDEDDEEEAYTEEPKTTIMEAARDILTETAASMEAAVKGQTGSIPVHNTGSFPVHTGSLPAQSPLNAEKAEKSEKHEDGEKPDPFRTQSIPIIGGGDSKYSELQFGQQNNNK